MTTQNRRKFIKSHGWNHITQIAMGKIRQRWLPGVLFLRQWLLSNSNLTDYNGTVPLNLRIRVKNSSPVLLNRQQHEAGELWQARFFDRALRTVKEYNEKVEYIHLNPAKAGLGRSGPG